MAEKGALSVRPGIRFDAKETFSILRSHLRPNMRVYLHYAQCEMEGRGTKALAAWRPSKSVECDEQAATASFDSVQRALIRSIEVVDTFSLYVRDTHVYMFNAL